jgi:hypothetical protein
MSLDQPIFTHPAVVSRAAVRPGASPSYLMLGEGGVTDWIADPSGATVFESMREAARMAFRLPAALKAFSLPCTGEAALY